MLQILCVSLKYALPVTFVKVLENSRYCKVAAFSGKKLLYIPKNRTQMLKHPRSTDALALSACSPGELPNGFCHLLGHPSKLILDWDP